MCFKKQSDLIRMPSLQIEAIIAHPAHHLHSNVSHFSVFISPSGTRDRALRITASHPLNPAAATSWGRTGWIDKQTNTDIPMAFIYNEPQHPSRGAQGTKQEAWAKHKWQCCLMAAPATVKLNTWNKCELWKCKQTFFLVSVEPAAVLCWFWEHA